jgi:hypothetical protein
MADPRSHAARAMDTVALNEDRESIGENEGLGGPSATTAATVNDTAKAAAVTVPSGISKVISKRPGPRATSALSRHQLCPNADDGARGNENGFATHERAPDASVRGAAVRAPPDNKTCGINSGTPSAVSRHQLCPHADDGVRDVEDAPAAQERAPDASVRGAAVRAPPDVVRQGKKEGTAWALALHLEDRRDGRARTRDTSHPCAPSSYAGERPRLSTRRELELRLAAHPTRATPAAGRGCARGSIRVVSRRDGVRSPSPLLLRDAAARAPPPGGDPASSVEGSDGRALLANVYL